MRLKHNIVAFSGIIAIFIVALFSFGCSNDSQKNDEPSKAFKEAKLQPFESGVDFVVEPLYKDGKVRFVGKTNLPDGTALMIEFRGVGYIAQNKAVVNGGSLETSTFSKDGSYLPKGGYILEVLTPIAAVQDPKIREIVGPNGENYKGSYVTTFNSDRIIKYTKPIDIK